MFYGVKACSVGAGEGLVNAGEKPPFFVPEVADIGTAAWGSVLQTAGVPHVRATHPRNTIAVIRKTFVLILCRPEIVSRSPSTLHGRQQCRMSFCS